MPKKNLKTEIAENTLANTSIIGKINAEKSNSLIGPVLQHMKMPNIIGFQLMTRQNDAVALHFSTVYSKPFQRLTENVEDGQIGKPEVKTLNAISEEYGIDAQEVSYPQVSFAINKQMMPNAAVVELVRIPKNEVDDEKLVAKIANAYDKYLLQQLKDLVEKRDPIDFNTLDGLDYVGKAAVLLACVTREAQDIAIKTRRGCANFAIASKKFAKIISMFGVSTFGAQEHPDIAVEHSDDALQYAGSMNDNQQLLIQDNTSNDDDCYAIVGYRGKMPSDTGFIHTPYISTIYSETDDSVIVYALQSSCLDKFYANCYYSIISFVNT